MTLREVLERRIEYFKWDRIEEQGPDIIIKAHSELMEYARYYSGALGGVYNYSEILHEVSNIFRENLVKYKGMY